MSRYVVCKPVFSNVVYFGRLIKSDKSVRVLRDVRASLLDEDVPTSVFKLSTVGPAPLTASTKECKRVEMVVSPGDVVFDVSTTAMLAWNGSHAAGVWLTASGANKIAVIKAIREITGLGLKETKDLVEAAPSLVTRSSDRSDIERVVSSIQSAGGSVELWAE